MSALSLKRGHKKISGYYRAFLGNFTMTSGNISVSKQKAIDGNIFVQSIPMNSFWSKLKIFKLL